MAMPRPRPRPPRPRPLRLPPSPPSPGRSKATTRGGDCPCRRGVGWARLNGRVEGGQAGAQRKILTSPSHTPQQRPGQCAGQTEAAVQFIGWWYVAEPPCVWGGGVVSFVVYPLSFLTSSSFCPSSQFPRLRRRRGLHHHLPHRGRQDATTVLPNRRWLQPLPGRQGDLGRRGGQGLLPRPSPDPRGHHPCPRHLLLGLLHLQARLDAFLGRQHPDAHLVGYRGGTYVCLGTEESRSTATTWVLHTTRHTPQHRA